MENETDNDDGIECPYCGYVNSEPETIYDTIKEDSEKYECESCGRSMNATQVIFYSWEATPRTKEWLEKEIKRIKENSARRALQCPECSTRYSDNEIEELQKEIINLKV